MPNKTERSYFPYRRTHPNSILHAEGEIKMLVLLDELLHHIEGTHTREKETKKERRTIKYAETIIKTTLIAKGKRRLLDVCRGLINTHTHTHNVGGLCEIDT